MRELPPPIVDRLRKELHDRFDMIVDDPLPEHWVDLIQHLNFEERARSKSVAAKNSSK